MHLLCAAHSERQDRGGEGRTRAARRRSRHGMPGRVPDRSNRLRQHQRSEQPCLAVEERAAQLFLARRFEHAATHNLPCGAEESEHGDYREGLEFMAEVDSPNEEIRTHETEPMIEPGHTFASVTDKISSLVLKRKTPLGWFIGFGISFMLFQLFMLAVTKLVFTGVGIFGTNQPVGWAMPIINFVWWIAIGHAGTLISAILLLLRQKWRTSINRFAEAMTLFAVACAGVFPLLHLGRPDRKSTRLNSSHVALSRMP